MKTSMKSLFLGFALCLGWMICLGAGTLERDAIGTPLGSFAPKNFTTTTQTKGTITHTFATQPNRVRIYSTTATKFNYGTGTGYYPVAAATEYIIAIPKSTTDPARIVFTLTSSASNVVSVSEE